MATRFQRPSTASSLPALCTNSPVNLDKNKKNCITPDGGFRQKRKNYSRTNNNNSIKGEERKPEKEKVNSEGKIVNGLQEVSNGDLIQFKILILTFNFCNYC